MSENIARNMYSRQGIIIILHSCILLAIFVYYTIMHGNTDINFNNIFSTPLHNANSLKILEASASQNLST
jgi:hypothetical protein